MSQENVEIVRTVFQLFSAGGAEAVLAVCDDAVVTRRVAPFPDPGTWHGHQGLLDAVADWTRTFDALEVTGDQFVDIGDHVVARVDQEARGRDSGAPVRATFWFVFRVRNGEIVALDMHASRSKALDAVGLSE